MVDVLENSGVSASVAYGAAAASIALSIGIWVLRKGGDRANAERFGIFVGLWAPTFMVIGNVLEDRAIAKGKLA
ncbi:MAG: hypothetical protein ACR2OO_17345 [Thermomicrobiales bacterium]